MHYLKVVWKMMSTRYTYDRTKLWWSYSKLILKSVHHHKLKSRRGKENYVQEELIMGLTIRFFDYIQIITLFEEIFIYQCYRFKCDHNAPVVIDCGSNIGFSALYFKTIYPNAQIVCFEPDRISFELMQINFKQNRLQDVTCYNLALTATAGTVNLYKPSIPGSLGMSLIPTAESDVEMVEAKNLSSYIQQNVDMVKIDVEGSEIQILSDLFETGKLGHIQQMVIEFHPTRTKSDLKSDLQALAAQGFDVTERDAGHTGPDKIIHFKK
jgi:FkbM family methyltransferase